jgi:hypothetical protein
MRLRASIIVLSVFCGMCLCGCRTVGQTAAFNNMTYVVGEEPRLYQRVQLTDGQYGDSLLCVYYDGQFVYGDFNRDGLQDAAVVLDESGCGSGYSLFLAFLINDGTQLVHRSSCYLGDVEDVVSLKACDGKVVVTMLVNNRDDWARHPVKRVRKTYEYVGPTQWNV